MVGNVSPILTYGIYLPWWGSSAFKNICSMSGLTLKRMWRLDTGRNIPFLAHDPTQSFCSCSAESRLFQGICDFVHPVVFFNFYVLHAGEVACDDSLNHPPGLSWGHTHMPVTMSSSEDMAESHVNSSCLQGAWQELRDIAVMKVTSLFTPSLGTLKNSRSFQQWCSSSAVWPSKAAGKMSDRCSTETGIFSHAETTQIVLSHFN